MNALEQKNHDAWDTFIDFLLGSEMDNQPEEMAYVNIFLFEASRMQHRGHKAPESMIINEVQRQITMQRPNMITGVTDNFIFTNHGWGLYNDGND